MARSLGAGPGGAGQLGYLDFESAVAELDTIVKKMEEGDLTLEKSMELYERGLQLSRFCHSQLEQAEAAREVVMVFAHHSLETMGQPPVSPFPPGDTGGQQDSARQLVGRRPLGLEAPEDGVDAGLERGERTVRARRDGG